MDYRLLVKRIIKATYYSYNGQYRSKWLTTRNYKGRNYYCREPIRKNGAQFHAEVQYSPLNKNYKEHSVRYKYQSYEEQPQAKHNHTITDV